MKMTRQLLVTLSAALAMGASPVCQRAAHADDTQANLTTHAGACGTLPNNLPLPNEHGHAATYSTQGKVDLEGAFFTPQGTNGRSCGSCHSPLTGWSMSAELMQQVFEQSDGLAPVFNALDADRGGADPVETLEQRRHAYSMLLKGKFTRNQTPPSNAEFTVIAADDPFGIGSTTRFWFFRRAMPTVNFRNHIVSWDGANTVGTSLHEGLARQARGNITGAQQGPSPANEAVVQEIVEYEKALSHAQLILEGVGRLDVGGAHGGPAYLSEQPLVAGRFDLFDAWIGSRHPRRAQIARGQEIFNNPRPEGGSCRGCHNAANDGQNVAGTFFDIGASRPEFATPDMAIYTLQNTTTGEVRETTDGGRGFRTGRWADLDRFKSPSLRGVSSRGEYFHNGIATSLEEVVSFYEVSLGFRFSAAERADLVAFLKAL
jgi:cytochrome c peroxidase